MLASTRWYQKWKQFKCQILWTKNVTLCVKKFFFLVFVPFLFGIFWQFVSHYSSIWDFCRILNNLLLLVFCEKKKKECSLMDSVSLKPWLNFLVLYLCHWKTGNHEISYSYNANVIVNIENTYYSSRPIIFRRFIKLYLEPA